MRKTYLVTHNIFPIDKFCFPSEEGNGFFELWLSKWPTETANIFEAVGKLTEIHDVRLIRGEVREGEGLTYLGIDSETKKNIQDFYVGFEKKLFSVGHNYDFSTVKIIIDPCRESNLGRINECANLINQYKIEEGYA